jgi:hypothetical protein
MFFAIYEQICQLDKYGYKFSFNFHGKEEKYNTFIGGSATLIMYSCLIALFAY